MQESQTVQEIVQQLNIIDDTLFQKMAEDSGFCEEMISTILQQKVIVKKVTPQNSVKNLQGLQEIYVNTKVDDGTDIAELMRIFTELEAYDFKKFPKVSKRKKQFAKEEKEKAEKDAMQSARKLFENGVSYEIVRASITTLSDEQLREIYQKVFENKS